jgi:hypothetical protein
MQTPSNALQHTHGATVWLTRLSSSGKSTLARGQDPQAAGAHLDRAARSRLLQFLRGSQRTVERVSVPRIAVRGTR